MPSLPEIITSVVLAAGPMQCVVPAAPVISIKPVTAPIAYDFSKSEADLTAIKSDTVNPYGLGSDTVTRGLRHDKPKMDYNIEFGGMTDPAYGSFCMWYKQVTVNISLSPKIYVAKESKSGKCGAFILEHEKKHVRVDREVMNKYSQMLGKSIQNAVNMAGAQGPYNLGQQEEVKKQMASHIESAINSVLLLMQNEMHQRQSAIDSLEEYQAGAAACAQLPTNNKDALTGIAQ